MIYIKIHCMQNICVLWIYGTLSTKLTVLDPQANGTWFYGSMNTNIKYML